MTVAKEKERERQTSSHEYWSNSTPCSKGLNSLTETKTCNSFFSQSDYFCASVALSNTHLSLLFVLYGYPLEIFAPFERYENLLVPLHVSLCLGGFPSGLKRLLSGQLVCCTNMKLSLNLQHSYKMPGRVDYTCYSSTGRQEDLCDLLANQAS